MTISIAVCGAIDNGKSTLIGKLLTMLNGIPQREFDLIKSETRKEKQLYANICDTDDSERQRGHTSSFSIHNCSYEGLDIELRDVPGHKIFIRETIQAFQTIDTFVIKNAIVIVSMIKNEIDYSTIYEHLLLLKCSGITNLIIACNKMTLINWDKAEVEKNIKPIIKYLMTSLLWEKTKISLVYIDAYEGTNLLTLDKPEFKYTLMEQVKNKFIQCDYIKDNSPVLYTKEITFPMLLLHVNVDKIFAVTFCMVVHYNMDGKNYEVEAKVKSFTNPKSKDMPFVKPPENIICTLEFSNTIEIKKGTSLILRDCDSTIGYGTYS